jgi:hypothetical protein
MSSNASYNLFAESKKPQVDYATFLAGENPENYEGISKEGYEFGDYTYQPTDNDGKSTGTAFPTIVLPGNHDVQVQYNGEDLSAYLLGKRAYQALGKIDSSTTTTGGNKIHKISLLDLAVSNQLPAFSYVEKNGDKAVTVPEPNPHNIGYPSLVTSSWEVTGEGIAVLRSNSTKVGSGKRLVNPAVNFKTAPLHVSPDLQTKFFKSNSSELKIWDGINQSGTLNNIGCSFRNFRLSVNPNLKLEDGYQGCPTYQISGDANSGNIRNHLHVGVPTVEASVDIIFEDNYNPVQIQQSLSPFSLQMKYVGGAIGTTGENYEAYFKFGKSYFSQVKTSILEDKNGLNLNFKPFASGFNFPFEIWVQNDTASYV